MAKLYNIARMTTVTTGTGTITLGSAVAGYLSFAAAGVSNGETVSYGIRDGVHTEVGTGVYISSGTMLTRSVTTSTNSNNPINLSGSAEVYITARAEDLATVVLLETQLISSSVATVDFSTAAAGFNNDFDPYEIRISSLTCTTDDSKVQLQIATSGPTWQAGASAYEWGFRTLDTDGTGGSQGDSGDLAIRISDSMGNATSPSERFSALIRYDNPEVAANCPQFVWSGIGNGTSGRANHVEGIGRFKTAGAFVGVRFIMTAGSISGGRFSLYGYKR